jgi:hypothetical protein
MISIKFLIFLFTDINDMVVVIVLMLRVNDTVLVHQQKYDNHFQS